MTGCPFPRTMAKVMDRWESEHFYFKHSIERVDRNGDMIDHVAGVEDFMLAKATYDSAVKRWPQERIRLCQESRIVEDSGNPT